MGRILHWIREALPLDKVFRRLKKELTDEGYYARLTKEFTFMNEKGEKGNDK